MTATWFVDTNVLIYEIDARIVAKQRLATEWMQSLWAERSGRISAQVLNEFYYTSTSKLTPGLSRAEAWQEVEKLLAWRPAALDKRVLKAAYRIQDRYAISWWDSLIVAAAQLQACDYLLTEDLQDGQILDGIEIVNPFLHRPTDYA